MPGDAGLSTCFDTQGDDAPLGRCGPAVGAVVRETGQSEARPPGSGWPTAWAVAGQAQPELQAPTTPAIAKSQRLAAKRVRAVWSAVAAVGWATDGGLGTEPDLCSAARGERAEAS